MGDRNESSHDSAVWRLQHNSWIFHYLPAFANLYSTQYVLCLEIKPRKLRSHLGLLLDCNDLKYALFHVHFFKWANLIFDLSKVRL